MNFFSNGYDTYAAESLDDIKSEMIAARIIDEEDFDQDEWSEVSPTEKAWIVPLEDIDMGKYKNDPIYRRKMKNKYLRSLEDIFAISQIPSETGKAFFICSTEY